ncbi:MAG: hypothetical protein ABR62_03410 [Actinobacteria bacterium BACL2 MAG-120820-bin50]|uniref:Uncharacterized protein n=1 Tax=Actinobacteria bacterium BACL2 MAG-120820-bin50 TaxID=1655570 RepID=A0A0R2QPG7_9ACTN|nr:MAG: hypothetical protein ABR62_03410 [Actinobacteria bacterium BACL2 MAG-120820-bin50]
MKKKLFRGFAVLATLALAAGLAVTPAHANKNIVVWADESRGPNLTTTLKTKGTGFLVIPSLLSHLLTSMR